jgi:hypothetical protein
MKANMSAIERQQSLEIIWLSYLRTMEEYSDGEEVFSTPKHEKAVLVWPNLISVRARARAT